LSVTSAFIGKYGNAGVCLCQRISYEHTGKVNYDTSSYNLVVQLCANGEIYSQSRTWQILSYRMKMPLHHVHL